MYKKLQSASFRFGHGYVVWVPTTETRSGIRYRYKYEIVFHDGNSGPVEENGLTNSSPSITTALRWLRVLESDIKSQNQIKS